MQQLNIATQVQHHINKLTEAIQDVKATMPEAETYGVDPSILLVTPALVPPIKVVIQRHALEVDVETSACPDDNSAQIDFSKLALEEVYNIHQGAAFKIRLRENDVAYQESKQQRKAKLCKALLKGKEQELQECITLLVEKEQEILGREQNHIALVDSIKNAITAFPPAARK